MQKRALIFLLFILLLIPFVYSRIMTEKEWQLKRNFMVITTLASDKICSGDFDCVNGKVCANGKCIIGESNTYCAGEEPPVLNCVELDDSSFGVNGVGFIGADCIGGRWVRGEKVNKFFCLDKNLLVKYECNDGYIVTKTVECFCVGGKCEGKSSNLIVSEMVDTKMKPRPAKKVFKSFVELVKELLRR